MRILAFNIAHDSSVCVINDGQIEFFCKEERLSGIKRDKAPFMSLDLYKSLNMGKVDHALYAVPSNNEPFFEDVYARYIEKSFGVKLENYSSLKHHDSHASLSAFHSGFDEALIVVVDRNGSIFFVDGVEAARESESVYTFSKKDGLKAISKNFWLIDNGLKNKNEISSILRNYYSGVNIKANSTLGVVKVYEAATKLIRQHVLENGKTMGLSSYGEPSTEPLFIDDVPLEHLFFEDSDKEVRFTDVDYLGTDSFTENNFQLYANKAKQVQEQTQDVVLNIIKKYVDKTGIKNVCMVGGYGLNVVANNYYIKNLPDVNFYFEPIADDTGITIGAALLKNYELSGTHTIPPKDNFYHYYDYSDTETFGQDSSIDEVCKLLINQKSVAIFQGSPEAGPRALGHRSILFDARNPDTKNIVNNIKKREWYRPFAGIVLEENFSEYFETLGIKSSPYMTINFEAKKHTAEIVPGVIHVDNTCRVQTVSNGFLYELLSKFNDETGCPILLNTSFNLAGKPLVQTKKDAIETFESSSLDALYFIDDNKILKK